MLQIAQTDTRCVQNITAITSGQPSRDEKLNARRIAHHVRGLNLRGTLNVVLKKSRITRVHEPGAGPVLTHSPSISTATKYRNTTTAICHPARLCATPPCSATSMVAVARSSGRRGRRFKSCHPDRYSRRSEARTRNGGGLSCCQYSSKIRQVQQRRRDLTCPSKGFPQRGAALRSGRREVTDIAIAVNCWINVYAIDQGAASPAFPRTPLARHPRRVPQPSTSGSCDPVAVATAVSSRSTKTANASVSKCRASSLSIARRVVSDFMPLDVW